MKMITCPFCGQQHPEDAEFCPATGQAITSSFLQVGKIVGSKYELLKLLGEGGMGAVYEARNVEIRNHVALKVLHGAMAHNPELRQRFIREAIAAAEIGHENIINVFDKGMDQATDSIYLVMELLKGETLADKIKRQGPIPVAETVDIMLQVLSGLKAAHQKGIIHRDMKPENIFLTKIAGRHNFVKLLDFGIAKMREPIDGKALTTTGTIMGTAHYMAPEQIAAGRDIDARADMYSCGVILYETLAGKVPFDAPSVHGVIYKIMNENPPAPADINRSIPKEMEKIILKAIHKDPRDRFNSMEEMARAIQPFGSGQVVFDRSSLLPPQQPAAAAGSVPVAGHPPIPVVGPMPAQATVAARPPRKGLSPVVILLIVFLPLVSIVALIALVLVNMFYFKEKKRGADLDWKKNKLVALLAPDAAQSADVVEAQGSDAAASAEAAEEEAAALVKRKLNIVSDPAGAEISIDGVVIGKAPLVYETEAENLKIEAKLDKYEVFKTDFQVKSDATDISIKMVKAKKKKKCDPRDPKCRSGGR